MARYTLEQIQQMISPQSQWGREGWTQQGFAEDGTPIWYSPDGEQMRLENQMMEGFSSNQPLSNYLGEQGILQFNPNDTSTANWLNQTYGTNFGNMADYNRWLYGAGDVVGDYFVLPEGMTAADYANTPLSYNPPDEGLDKWMPYLIAGGALAGLGGFLPGTESVFGGGAAGAAGAPTFTGGASGAGIAGAAGGGGALSGLTAAEMAAIGAGGAGAGGALAGGGEFVGGASGGGLSGGEFLGGATGGEIAGGATGGALSGAGGAAVSGATQGATSALGRILGGTATSDDWLSVLGGAGSSLLGVLGSNAQADAYGNVASQYLGLGAPFREKLLQSYAPGFSMADQPDFQNALDIGAQAAARATSARVGNPVDNPGAYAEMQKYITGSLALPQLNTYRSQLGSFGQLGTNTAGTASMGEASQAGGMYNALGYGLGQLTRPQNQNQNVLSNMLLNSGFSF